MPVGVVPSNESPGQSSNVGCQPEETDLAMHLHESPLKDVASAREIEVMVPSKSMCKAT